MNADGNTHSNGPAPKTEGKKRALKSKTAAEESAIPAPAPDDSADLAWQREYFANHRLEAARIPRRFWNKTLKNFTTKDKITRDLVAGATSFVEGFNFKREYPKGLFMIGPVGCGKTHLAVAILCEIIRKGYSGLYYNSPDLLRDIRATFDENSSGNEDELLQEITEVDLLVFDDLGAEKVSDFVLDRFYLIVNKRYEGCKPIIVTSNYDEEILRARFGDRILSRLDEMCARFDRFPKQDFRRLSLEKQLKLDSKNL